MAFLLNSEIRFRHIIGCQYDNVDNKVNSVVPLWLCLTPKWKHATQLTLSCNCLLYLGMHLHDTFYKNMSYREGLRHVSRTRDWGFKLSCGFITLLGHFTATGDRGGSCVFQQFTIDTYRFVIRYKLVISSGCKARWTTVSIPMS